MNKKLRTNPSKVVADVMTRDVVSVSPGTEIESAARLMADRHVSGLPVVDDGRPVGVVSLMDLVDPDRAQPEEAAHKSPYYLAGDGSYVGVFEATVQSGGVVSDVMTPYVISVSADASIREAAKQMTEYRVHRLLVMEGEALVGLVSSLDLLDGFLDIDD